MIGLFQSTLPTRGETKASQSTAGALEFQSTLPTRGETFQKAVPYVTKVYFNPLSPHGERPGSARRVIRRAEDFNPLSPHGERPLPASFVKCRMHFNPLSPHGERPLQDDPMLSCWLFQSTLPTRGETWPVQLRPPHQTISIHSPHTGRDSDLLLISDAEDISIHSPHTGRDGHLRQPDHLSSISIHSPHTGRDPPHQTET